MRASPLHDPISRLRPRWGEINGMRIPFGYAQDAGPSSLALADCSCFARTGLKGPQAAAWLARQGVPVPAQPNHWEPLPAGGLIGRLATSEFFIEDRADGDAAVRVAASLGHGAPGVYPVLRQDAALALAGRGALEALAQTCSVNFGAIDPASRQLVLTSMAGVSVLVIPQQRNGSPLYRIWCDPTLGPYLWHTLLEIVAESSGGPVGLTGLGLAQP